MTNEACRVRGPVTAVTQLKYGTDVGGHRTGTRHVPLPAALQAGKGFTVHGSSGRRAKLSQGPVISEKAAWHSGAMVHVCCTVCLCATVLENERAE